MMRAFACLLLAAAGCASGPTEPRADPGPDAASLEFTDLDGTAHRPLSPSNDDVHVIVFVTDDCPIANQYAPEIQAIANDHATDPVHFYLVHVDQELGKDAARAHAADYRYDLPILMDRDHVLVRATGATVTPEVAVLTGDAGIVYRGRIDDRYAELGRKRGQARTHELRDAIRAALDGAPVVPARTEAVGCFIPEPPPAPDARLGRGAPR